MAFLEIFTYLFFFSFLPHLASTTCQRKCSSDGPPVRSPFWIHSSSCGFQGFNLSCNNQTQTILTLPSSGDFIVDNIKYLHQTLTINDTKNCLIKRFLDHKMDLIPLYFTYLYNVANYTFFNCSPTAKQLNRYPTLSCLSSDSHKVIAVPTNPSFHADPVTTSPEEKSLLQAPTPFDPNCSMISIAMIPIKPKNYDPEPPNPSEWEDINFGVQLQWDEPDCRFYESIHQTCGILWTSMNGPEVRCQHKDSGSSKAREIATVIGSVISVGLWLIWFALRLIRCDSSEQSTENEQLPVGINGGLDQATIESYPKTQLCESRPARPELPSTGGNACPICLEEYQPKETIRTIPKCSHYFHTNCVDTWLTRNPTCPLCRNLPQREKDTPFINKYFLFGLKDE